MPFVYRARIEAFLATHTAPFGDRYIIIIDDDAFLQALGDLIEECIKERVADVFRERTD
jgi:hypothetical protein